MKKFLCISWQFRSYFWSFLKIMENDTSLDSRPFPMEWKFPFILYFLLWWLPWEKNPGVRPEQTSGEDQHWDLFARLGCRWWCWLQTWEPDWVFSLWPTSPRDPKVTEFYSSAKIIWNKCNGFKRRKVSI